MPHCLLRLLLLQVNLQLAQQGVNGAAEARVRKLRRRGASHSGWANAACCATSGSRFFPPGFLHCPAGTGRPFQLNLGPVFLHIGFKERFISCMLIAI